MNRTYLATLVFSLTCLSVSALAGDLYCDRAAEANCLELYNWQPATQEDVTHIFYLDHQKYYFEADSTSPNYVADLRVHLGDTRVYLKFANGSPDMTIGHLKTPFTNPTSEGGEFSLDEGVSFTHSSNPTIIKECSDNGGGQSLWEIYQVDLIKMIFTRGAATATLTDEANPKLINRYEAPNGCP